MGNIKKIILTIDIDNDFTTVPLENSNTLEWDGLTKGLPIALSEFNRFAVKKNIVLSITIFCRADWQVEKLMGDAAWVFDKTTEVLSSNSYKNLKIDLQWHPHLYENRNNQWKLASSGNSQLLQLEDIFNKLRISGHHITCSRIGECFFNDEILKKLIDLNLKVDSTAFPGRHLGHTDWSLAPREAYFPSPNNFYEKVEKSPILEVPFTMIPIAAPYETEIKDRYLNLIFDPKYVTEELKSAEDHFFVTILHPFEILTLDRQDKHQLFGPVTSIFENLETIFSHQGISSIFLKDIAIYE